MNTRKNTSTPCVIRDSAMRYARRAGLLDNSTSDLEDCRVMESVRQLMALGLSTDEIEELDIRQPMLQAICETAGLDDLGRDRSDRAMEAVEVNLKVVSDEVQKLDMELEMLSLRKRALLRRSQILTKIADSLSAGDSNLLAA